MELQKQSRSRAKPEQKSLYLQRAKKLRDAIGMYKKQKGGNFLKQVEIHLGRELTKKERQDYYNVLNGHSYNQELLALLEKIFL